MSSYSALLAAPPSIATILDYCTVSQRMYGNGDGIGDKGEDYASRHVLESTSRSVRKGGNLGKRVVLVLSLPLGQRERLPPRSSCHGGYKLLLGSGCEDAVDGGACDEGN